MNLINYNIIMLNKIKMFLHCCTVVYLVNTQIRNSKLENIYILYLLFGLLHL